MNPVGIILGAVAAGEGVIICLLLYAMNKVMEAAADYRAPLEPIDIEEDDFDD